MIFDEESTNKLISLGIKETPTFSSLELKKSIYKENLFSIFARESMSQETNIKLLPIELLDIIYIST